MIRAVLATAGGGLLGIALGVVIGMLLTPEPVSKKGVSLQPVVVAARAVQAGEALEMDDITQRSIPETLISADLVLPDSASYVVSQRLHAPLAAGEPLRWSDFSVRSTTVERLAARSAAEAACAKVTAR